MHQAAASPPTVFTGTLIAATSKVRRIAASASGSVIAASTAGSPFCNASVNTTASGSSRIRPTAASAPRMAMRRPVMRRGGADAAATG